MSTSRSKSEFAALVVLAILGFGAPLSSAAITGATVRVSVSSSGEQGNASSIHAAVSARGRYVAFSSSATNLTPNGTGGGVFLRDLRGGTTELISVSLGGVSANGFAGEPAVNATGRYVAFRSSATDLVPNDTNGERDIFVRDRLAGTTELISVSSEGEHGNADSLDPAISGNGRYVVFESESTSLVAGDSNARNDVFVRDLMLGTTSLASINSQGAQARGFSGNAAISADGRYVGFESRASNLAPGDTNDAFDIFVHDMNTGTTEMASVDDGGVQGTKNSWYAALSADGRYVAFYAGSPNLVPDDTNTVWDVFVRDRLTGTTERVSVTSGGAEASGYSQNPVISAGGRYVAFESPAPDLVPDDTNQSSDVFFHDRLTGTTERVSVTSGGAEASGYSQNPVISAGGRYVAFESPAPDLVPDDTNQSSDVYFHDRLTGTTERVSLDSDGVQGDGTSWVPAITANGRVVAFQSWATNLVSDDTNDAQDVFVHASI